MEGKTADADPAGAAADAPAALGENYVNVSPERQDASKPKEANKGKQEEGNYFLKLILYNPLIFYHWHGRCMFYCDVGNQSQEIAAMAQLVE